jgi:hypothetical protein
VFADGQTHGFVGTPPTAICAAGLLLARTGGWFDPDDDQACFTCAHLTSSHAGSAASA